MSQVAEHPLAAIADAGAEQFESSANKQATTHAQVALELLDQFGQAESTQSRVLSLYSNECPFNGAFLCLFNKGFK